MDTAIIPTIWAGCQLLIVAQELFMPICFGLAVENINYAARSGDNFGVLDIYFFLDIHLLHSYN